MKIDWRRFGAMLDAAAVACVLFAAQNINAATNFVVGVLCLIGSALCHAVASDSMSAAQQEKGDE